MPAVDVDAVALTHTGPRREQNEDAVIIRTALTDDDLHVAAVADGLGGHLAGEVASRLAIDAIARRPLSASERPERWLRQTLNAANLDIWHYGQDHPEAFNLQSTATVLLIDGQNAVVGHVGDCRVYVIHEGEIEQWTADHTRAMEMLQLRIITPEQARTHPARSQLTRSLGAELLVSIDVSRRLLVQGDTYVLCSDGLWSEIGRDEIKQIVRGNTVEHAAQTLLDTAIARDAADNISVAVVRITGEVSPAPASSRSWLPWR
jgi:PPM family protein phosphatase